MAGFEPTASKSQTSRATSCATPRWVKIFNFSVKSVSGQICGQKFFAETHGGGKARKRKENGDFASFRRSAYEAVTRSQTSRATSCATPRGLVISINITSDTYLCICRAPARQCAVPGQQVSQTNKQALILYYSSVRLSQFRKSCAPISESVGTMRSAPHLRQNTRTPSSVTSAS